MAETHGMKSVTLKEIQAIFRDTAAIFEGIGNDIRTCREALERSSEGIEITANRLADDLATIEGRGRES